MVSLSTAAIVAFIMSLRLEALSRWPVRTSLSLAVVRYLLRLTRLRRVGACPLSYTHYEPLCVRVVNAECGDAASLQEHSYALS